MKSEIANRQSKIANLIVAVARAVHHAHQRGIIHRDLKPGNILIDEHNQPHVTDFGLAKILGHDSNLTRSEAALGTPSYMAPEQAAGRGKQLTTASDVFSLGSILYELLTGRPPFKGATPLETMNQVVHEEPAAPRSCNPEADADLETICLKCLEKEPAARISSALALAEELERWLRHEPILSRPSSLSERLRKWVKRSPAVSALAGTSLLFLIALAIGSAVAAWRIRESALELRRHLYDSEIGFAFQAWDAGRASLVRELIEKQRPSAGEADLRGFEWRHLWAISRPQETLIRSTPDQYGFWSCAVSPDGKILAGGTSDGHVLLWNFADGHLLKTLHEPIASILATVDSIAFTPDNRSLAHTRRQQKDVLFWDLHDGSIKLRLEHHRQSVSTVALSRDGNLAATSGGYPYTTEDDTGELLLWDVPTGTLAAEMPGRKEALVRADFSPDGKLLAAGGRKGQVKLWDVTSRSEIGELPKHSGIVFGLSFSPDGQRLATVDSAGSLRVWDANTRELIWLRPAHDGSADRVVWSPDGSLVCTGGRDHLVKLWSADRGEGRAVLRGHAGRVNGIAFTPDGRFLVTASQDKTLRVWELSRYEWSGTFTLPGPHIQLYENLAFSPDSRSVALPIGTNRIGIVEIAAQKIVAEYPGKNPAYSTERDRLAVLVSTNRIAIWDASKRELLRELDAGFPLAGPPVFNSDATILTARGSKGGVFVWHLGESPSARILNLTAPVSAGLFFGSNAHELAVVHANNGTIEWFDLESGRTRASLATGTAPVSCVSLSPDRSQVALAETGPRVRVHALRSGKTDILNGDDGSILSLAWSPDSRRLAVGSFEGSVKLWNVATRREVCTLRGNLSMLTALAFSSDGRHLVAGSVADDTRIWSTPLLIETENRP